MKLEPICRVHGGRNVLDGLCLLCENTKLRAEVEALKSTNFIRLRADLQEKELQLDELRKEFKFRIDLADTWVTQLREALGEAMDVLASDPHHDVSLQARLEITRRGVDCTGKRNDEAMVWRACSEHKALEKKPFKWGPPPLHPCPNCEYRAVTGKAEMGPETFTDRWKNLICDSVLGAHHCGLTVNHECQHRSGDGVSWPD